MAIGALSFGARRSVEDGRLEEEMERLRVVLVVVERRTQKVGGDVRTGQLGGQGQRSGRLRGCGAW